MPEENRRKKRGRRRTETLKFAYSGPFVNLVDPRVGRTLPITEERYAATSAESYTVGDALGADTVRALESRFGRGAKRRRGGRGRRGGRRVQA